MSILRRLASAIGPMLLCLLFLAAAWAGFDFGVSDVGGFLGLLIGLAQAAFALMLALMAFCHVIFALTGRPD